MTFQTPDRFSPSKLLDYVDNFKTQVILLLAGQRKRFSFFEIFFRSKDANDNAELLTGKAGDKIFEGNNIPLAKYLFSRAVYLLEEEGKIKFNGQGYVLAS